MGRLDGKVALITGVGGGMGRAAALRFSAEGARVVGCDMDAATSAETARLVEEAGGAMTVFAPVDLGDAAAAAAWVEAAIAVHGSADILYNNASSPRFGAVEELSIADWDHTMRNELDLVFYATKAIWPHFRAGARGWSSTSDRSPGSAGSSSCRRTRTARRRAA